MITEAKQARGSAHVAGSGRVTPPRAAEAVESDGAVPQAQHRRDYGGCEAAKPAPSATAGLRPARADVRAGESGGVVPPRQAQRESGAIAASGPAQAVHPYLTRLEGLAKVLSRQGLRVSLMAPPGRVPSLHVVNPAASVLAEDVYTGRGRDGAWWFWWSWAERIASGEDLEGAAAMIKRVLAARD
jgi:hypothetical protein